MSANTLPERLRALREFQESTSSTDIGNLLEESAKALEAMAQDLLWLSRNASSVEVRNISTTSLQAAGMWEAHG